MSVLRVGKASSNAQKTLRNEDVMFFLNNIRDKDVLTPEEENELFYTIRNGKTEEERMAARNKLIECHQRFVFSLAKSYANGDNVMDYVQEANNGLIQAIDKFDQSRGMRFLTYAVWYMRREILSYITNLSSSIKTSNKQKLMGIIPRLKNKFLQEHERYPEPEELLELIEEDGKVKIIDKRDVAEVFISSIDEFIHDDNNNEPTPIQKEFNSGSASYNDYEDEIERESMKAYVESILSYCNEKEQNVIKMHYGIGYDYEYSPEAVAEYYNMTVTRVQQIRKNAFEKIRKFATVPR
jgi:RNA polymerase primary sigma factor